MENTENVAEFPEHLKRKAVRAPLNDHIATGLMLAVKAVLELARREFTVLGVMIGGPKPAIRIQSCAQCADLNGVWFRRVAANGAREDTMVAIVEGCQVQWTRVEFAIRTNSTAGAVTTEWTFLL